EALLEKFTEAFLRHRLDREAGHVESMAVLPDRPRLVVQRKLTERLQELPAGLHVRALQPAGVQLVQRGVATVAVTDAGRVTQHVLERGLPARRLRAV